MKRRDAIKLLGAAAASHVWPRSAWSQGGRIPKIGFLYPGLSSAVVSRMAAFRDGLREAGWGDGRIEIVPRFAESVGERNAVLARELVAAGVDVLSPISVVSVNAARAATKTVPIVAFDLESDPVASGMAATLSRPGGNISGVFFDYPDFSTKWMELLKEALPRLSRLVVIRDPASPSPQLKGVQRVAASMNVTLDLVEVKGLGALDDAFAAAAGKHPDAVLILSSPLFGTNPKLVAAATLANRLPAITLFPEFARAGGLMAYGVDLLGAFHQTGGMVAKVLGGAKVGELPIERPVKFQLVVNATTAQALGINLPTSILLRADEVIE